MSNPQTSLDVEVLLSEVIGSAKKLTGYVDIIKEKNKPNALIRPKKYIPNTIWKQIHYKVKDWNGKWAPKERLWVVPLEH